MNRERWLVVLDSDGAVRKRVDLPYAVFRVAIDADERVWVQVWAENRGRTGSYLVLDRDLHVVASVAERNVQDARGEQLLSIAQDTLGLLHMYLLEQAGR